MLRELALLAVPVLMFLAALAGFWLALFWAIRWGAFALSTRRPAALRRQRAFWAVLGSAAGLGSAALGFVGIAAVMRYSFAP